ncbi:MAG: hypothetical protein JW702_06725 [Clostridiales bacterium]|nr:hypothetical protein [Clostridiales bacterium]
MIPVNFLEYPEYFAFFMIWASGYVFVYSIFSRTREWEKFDSTMKLVTSLFAGVGIEFCLIFPIFFLFPNNMNTAILFPAFEETWMFHWLLTGIVHMALRKIPNKTGVLLAFHFLVKHVLFLVFMTIAIIFAVLLVEFSLLYSTYVHQSAFFFIFYSLINFTFSSIAVVFCFIFPDYLEDAIKNESNIKGKGYSEHIWDKHSLEEIREFYSLRKFKKRAVSFSKSKKLFLPTIISVIIAGIFIPLDINYHFFTPNIETSTNSENFDAIYFLSIESFFSFYNSKPEFNIEVEKTTYDHVKIDRGTFDLLDTIIYPIPSRCLRNQVFVGNFPSTNYFPSSLRVIYSKDFEDNVTISAIPTDSTPENLKIGFITKNQKNLNFTMEYFTNTTLKNVEVNAMKLRGDVYNSTHDRWIQEYQIINNEEFHIYLQKLSYDQLIYESTEKNTSVFEFNGNIVEYVTPISDTYSGLYLTIGKGKTATVSISFLSTNKFPY